MNEISKIGQVPAHILAASDKLSLNAAAHAGIQASFAVLKIRGKVWRVRHRGEETLLQESPGTGRDGRPLPVTPVQHLDVVVVGVATPLSKKYYLGGYVDGESKAPDCFSVNGMVPDPASRAKQSTHCATCPQNIWGSATNAATGKKSKACRDGRRIAVVPSGDEANIDLGGPMLLDIPPTSLAALDRYTTYLERNGADISQVITRISFDATVTHQSLVFEDVGWVPSAEVYALVCEHGRSDQVERMLNEEIVNVTYDAEQPAGVAASQGARPAHLEGQARAAPGAAVLQPAQTMADVAQAALDAKARAAAASQAAQLHQAQQAPQDVAEPPVTTVVKKPTPFSQAQQAQHLQAQPAPQPVAADAEPPVTVVRSAPDDMQAAIDNLLN